MKKQIRTIGWLFIFFLIACNSQEKDKNNSEAIKNKIISVVNHDGTDIAYQKCGVSDTTLLFVHGWCIDKSYWDNQVDYFCDQYAVVTIDLPGMHAEKANRNAWSIYDYASDITSVIDELKLQHVILIGHSMGGDICLETAIKRPGNIIGFIGIDNFKDAGIEPDELTRNAIKEFFGMLRKDFPEVSNGYARDYLFSSGTDSIVRQRVCKDFASSNPDVSVQALQGTFNYGPSEIESLKKLKKKVYLINSDVTPTDLTNFNKNKIPVEVLPIAGTGHFPMLEKPAEFNLLIKKAVEKIIADE